MDMKRYGWTVYWGFLAAVNGVSAIWHGYNGRWGWVAWTVALAASSAFISRTYYRKARV